LDLTNYDLCRSATYSVLINGRPVDLITLSRGLRQGDQLFPYLFLLCEEGFSFLLQRAEREGSISRVPVSAKGYQLSHLFFTDDSLLFCQANFMEWMKIHQLLHLYELASGQKLNTEKTSIFSARIPSASLRSILVLLWAFQRPRGTGNIWGYQLWWAVQRKKPLLEGEIGGLEGEILLAGRQGNPSQGRGSSHSHLCYECVPPPQNPL
jgi:hypothetical protein